MKEQFHDLLPVKTLTPILGHTTAEGTGDAVDLAGFESALMLAHVGVSGDTLAAGLKWTVQFQESDTTTPGDFTDIAAADLVGGDNAVVIDDPAEDDVVIARAYVGAKRYLRILFTQTGTHTNGTPIAAVVIKGKPRHAPVA
jgi:hypothetical protein